MNKNYIKLLKSVSLSSFISLGALAQGFGSDYNVFNELNDTLHQQNLCSEISGATLVEYLILLHPEFTQEIDTLGQQIENLNTLGSQDEDSIRFREAEKHAFVEKIKNFCFKDKRLICLFSMERALALNYWDHDYAHFADTIEQLSSEACAEVLNSINRMSCAAVIPHLSQETRMEVLPKMDEHSLAGSIIELDFEKLSEVLNYLHSEKLAKVIQHSIKTSDCLTAFRVHSKVIRFLSQVNEMGQANYEAIIDFVSYLPAEILAKMLAFSAYDSDLIGSIRHIMQVMNPDRFIDVLSYLSSSYYGNAYKKIVKYTGIQKFIDMIQALNRDTDSIDCVKLMKYLNTKQSVEVIEKLTPDSRNEVMRTLHILMEEKYSQIMENLDPEIRAQIEEANGGIK